ncbi:MAG: M15 family metallopeptidase [Patescibacteria group bacterium]
MKKHLLVLIETQKNAIAGFALVVLGLLAYGGYRYYGLSEEFKVTKEQFASTTMAFESNIKTLQEALSQIQGENAKLSNALGDERGKNDFFDAQIKGIQTAVGILDKMVKTDSELLQKYSKVYFLNENYIPESLANINTEFLYQKEKPAQFHAKALPYLQTLFQTASQNNLPIHILSAYRSFGEQSSLKASYKTTFGSGANQFSADQGYSEHQLGTAIDVTTSTLGASFEGFEKTTAFTWLTQNAHKYGFALSYPKNNSFYQFEPWHWRFVGVELATKLFNENKYFYDLDQREIDSYLVSIFN